MSSVQDLSRFFSYCSFLLVLCLIASYVGESVIGHAIWYDTLANNAKQCILLKASR